MDISVLLPAYNAERYIGQSVQSVLAQTHERFELLVVDDCSTDGTRAILAGFADERLRIIGNPANLGVVGSLNRAMAEARGRYIVRLDADDCCLPTRFAKQKAFLDSSPGTVLVATEMSVLTGGHVQFSRDRADPDPAVVRWMLHIANPVGHPSMMFRADAVARLDHYLSEDLKYAEDFDFTHRMLKQGAVAVLPEYLTIYRQHDTNLTRLHRAAMVARTAEVLGRVYEDLLGRACAAEAKGVAEHLLAGEPLQDREAWDRLRTFLEELGGRFRDRYHPTSQQWDRASRFTGILWNRLVRRHASAGLLRDAAHGWSHQPGGGTRGPLAGLAPAAVGGMLPKAAQPAVRALRALRRPREPDRQHDIRLNGIPFQSAPEGKDSPPTLYVVVDTESEFDWTAPMDRNETRVSSAGKQDAAQAIFDGHGLRPIYVVDHAIASQPQGYEPLRAILRRHGCVIGAHLHPWTTPPFDEEVSERNSFAGNLPDGLEERKMHVLVDAIQANFGVRPLFYKSGRYGLSAATIDILDRLGFQVDFSIMPQADLRPKGGPDFRAAATVPYRVPGNAVLSIPMSRAQTGLLSPVPSALHDMLHSPALVRLRLPGLLSRAGLLNTVTLTPEGMTVPEQIGMLRAMERRGHRTFVLHYHSPSLGGFTPYVRNERDRVAFVENIRAVCHFFMGAFGGMPGNPADLVPPGMRDMIWPDRPAEPALRQAAATRPG